MESVQISQNCQKLHNRYEVGSKDDSTTVTAAATTVKSMWGIGVQHCEIPYDQNTIGCQIQLFRL